MKWIEELSDLSDSTIAIGVFAFVVLLMSVVAALLGTSRQGFALLILSAITGGLLGWLVGILISPYSGEEAEFTKLTTTITSFLTGYMASRFGNGWRMFVESKSYKNPLYMERIGFAFCTFLLAIMLTFITRKYSGIGIVLKPEKAELKAGQEQKFEAQVQGLSIKDINWVLEPELGTIDQQGVYHAPSSIDGAHTVTVIGVDPRRPNARAVANINLKAA